MTPSDIDATTLDGTWKGVPPGVALGDQDRVLRTNGQFGTCGFDWRSPRALAFERGARDRK